jgi:hypothetical protein
MPHYVRDISPSVLDSLGIADFLAYRRCAGTGERATSGQAKCILDSVCGSVCDFAVRRPLECLHGESLPFLTAGVKASSVPILTRIAGAVADRLRGIRTTEFLHTVDGLRGLWSTVL